jgi:hypothetical protein
MNHLPDLTIDGVSIEVKFSRDKELDMISLKSKIDKGFKQGDKIVAIHTSDLTEKIVPSYKSAWLPQSMLWEALETGIGIVKNEKKSILLFTGTNNGYLRRLIVVK